MRFDPSGLESAFDKMRNNASSQGKSLADVLAKGFLADIKKESFKIAPTAQTLTEVAVKLNWRLKRKRGVTPAKELARRIRAKGTFARGWQFWKTESARFRIRIWLIDKSSNSETVDSQKKVSDKAANITGSKFKTKLNQMADRIMGGFR